MDVVGLLTSNRYVEALIVFVLFFIGSKLSVYVFEKYLIKLASKTDFELDDVIIRKSGKPISSILVLLGAKLALIPLGLSDIVLSYITKGLSSLIIVIATFWIADIIGILLTEWGEKFAAKSAREEDENLVILGKKISYVLILILGLLFILSTWDVEVGPFLASLGIAGIAVAFALQNTLSNIFGGVSLILDKTLKVGDVIKLNSGVTGEVLDVGLRSTIIKTFDNEVVSVPNGKLADAEIQNIVDPDPSVRVVIPFGVAYGANIDKVKKIVLKEVETVKGYIKKPAPSVMFLEMGDSALMFKAYFWVKSYKDRFAAMDQANTLIYNALRKNKIDIPFPQIDVYLKK